MHSKNGSAKIPENFPRDRLGKYSPLQKVWVPVESEKSQGGEGSDRFYATVLVPQRLFSIRFAVFVVKYYRKYFLMRSLEIQE